MNYNSDLSFSKLTPYLGSFIIFLGITRLLFYYYSFGVNITPYLEFSEIITSFLDIMVIVIITIVFSVIQRFLQNTKRASVDRNQERLKLMAEPKFLKRLKQYLLYHIEIIIYFIIYVLLNLIRSLFSKYFDYSTLIYLFIFFLALFIYGIIVIEVDIKHQQFESSDTDKFFTGLLLYCILFIGITLYYTYNQVKDVKDNKITYGTYIVLDNNQTLFSDSSNYFIGKTKEFIFYYHEKTKQTDIIPVTRLKQLTTLKIDKSR